jgi:hypothetical protein
MNFDTEFFRTHGAAGGRLGGNKASEEYDGGTADGAGEESRGSSPVAPARYRS